MSDGKKAALVLGLTGIIGGLAWLATRGKEPPFEPPFNIPPHQLFTTTIYGRVTDKATGQPIEEGLWARLTGVTSPGELYMADIYPGGYYLFRDLEPGLYDFDVGATGYNGQSHLNYEVPVGKVLRQDVKLKSLAEIPPGYSTVYGSAPSGSTLSLSYYPKNSRLSVTAAQTTASDDGYYELHAPPRVYEFICRYLGKVAGAYKITLEPDEGKQQDWILYTDYPIPSPMLPPFDEYPDYQ